MVFTRVSNELSESELFGIWVLVQGVVLRLSGMSNDILRANFGNWHIWASRSFLVRQ